jgi:hypothetical protein
MYLATQLFLLSVTSGKNWLLDLGFHACMRCLFLIKTMLDWGICAISFKKTRGPCWMKQWDLLYIERSIFQTSWKDDCCPDFLFLTLETSGLHHRTGFDQIFWFLTQIGPAKWLNWAKQLICGCCFTSVEVCSKRRNNSWFLASTVVIQQPHMSYYNPFNHCICPIWVQSQKFWSKPGLWWRPEVPKSKYKKLGQQSSFRRLGKYSFKWKGN